MQETEAGAAKAGQEKKGYVGIHATGFKELMLKPELLQAITDCGFEHPSEGARLPARSVAPPAPPRRHRLNHATPSSAPAVQHECIPHAILGMDVLCQAKSGMGKTAVFVLSILQQLDVKPGEVSAIVLCHTRELAFQVCSTGDLGVARPHAPRPATRPGAARTHSVPRCVATCCCA